jgi:alpha-L-rhamnosidase
MGDAALTAEEAMLNFEMSSVYTNWLNIIEDDQNSDGSVTNTVPSLGDHSPGAPNWETSYPTILWVMLKYRDDVDVVQAHMPSLKAYFNFFNAQYQKNWSQELLHWIW